MSRCPLGSRRPFLKAGHCGEGLIDVGGDQFISNTPLELPTDPAHRVVDVLPGKTLLDHRIPEGLKRLWPELGNLGGTVQNAKSFEGDSQRRYFIGFLAIPNVVRLGELEVPENQFLNLNRLRRNNFQYHFPVGKVLGHELVVLFVALLGVEFPEINEAAVEFNVCLAAMLVMTVFGYSYWHVMGSLLLQTFRVRLLEKSR
jgi:hypothetical protein